MQMVVLLNDFEEANHVLKGENSNAKQFGTIHYYEDEDLEKWCKLLKINESYGMRAFWDLQQNQEVQKEEAWQEQMLNMELRVSQVEPYRSIAFFHHIILTKN